MAEDVDDHAQDRPALSGVLARPEDVLPGVIDLLPMTERPFFPSQVMPLVLSAEEWLDTVKHAHEKNNDIIGLVYADSADAKSVKHDSFSGVGTACRIHQVDHQESALHVVLIGVERFGVSDWVSKQRPFAARVEYFPEQASKDSTEIKAYTTAIINVIK